MLSLQPHHIVDLYCLVDELLPHSLPNPQGGAPKKLTDSELVTLLIWNVVVVKQKTLKDLWLWMVFYHKKDFPRMPKYRGFVTHCHRVLPQLIWLLQMLLCEEEAVRLMDATMLPVCKTKRADSHRVAAGLAAFGKNHQGWHFGFKLHTSIDPHGRLCGFIITPANVHDAQMMPWILNEHTDIAVGDTTYGASVMGRIIWDDYGTIIVAPPHPKQKKKLMTKWQYLLLRFRSKIESVFDYLKEHLHLVTSFPRSPQGYLLHYIRILLAYQVASLAALH
jgi:hypothetical protein